MTKECLACFTHYLLFCLFQANSSKCDNEFSQPLPLASAQLGPSRPKPIIAPTARKINDNLNTLRTGDI